jgi:GNAT superfamily N-acetyltransferase
LEDFVPYGEHDDGDGALALRWEGPAGYWVSDDGSLIDVERVHSWLSEESYWAAGRPRDVMARSIEYSLVLGLYAPTGEQVGFARMVTDRATFAWLCDVFVAAEHRGNGVGTFLVRTAVEHPDVAGIRQLLMATPGRSLYRRHGFGDLLKPERWMERPARVKRATTSRSVNTLRHQHYPGQNFADT